MPYKYVETQCWVCGKPLMGKVLKDGTLEERTCGDCKNKEPLDEKFQKEEEKQDG